MRLWMGRHKPQVCQPFVPAFYVGACRGVSFSGLLLTVPVRNKPGHEIAFQARFYWLRGRDLNPRPLGYEPNELPDCSTPRRHYARNPHVRQQAIPPSARGPRPFTGRLRRASLNWTRPPATTAASDLAAEPPSTPVWLGQARKRRPPQATEPCCAPAGARAGAARPRDAATCGSAPTADPARSRR